MALFTEQGYEATTVNQIAAAAGVSHMTFFRYFPTKEDVVLLDDFDPLLEQLIRARPADEPPLERVRAAISEGLQEIYVEHRDTLLARVELQLSIPALRGRMWENESATQRLFERALSGIDESEHVPLGVRVVAAACLATLTTALVTWARGEQDGELPEIIDAAFAALRAETE